MRTYSGLGCAARKQDMDMRVNILSNIQVMLRQYKRTEDRSWFAKAEEFGKVSNALKVRIDTYDYARERDEEDRLSQLSTRDFYQ